MRIAGNTMQQAIDAETDIFGRDQFADGLLNLFESSDDPLVVALDEKWGTGKTVFARRLQKQAADRFTVIYFDAFKRDYDPDVFIALSAELLAKLPADREKKSSLKENAKAVGKTIGKLTLKAGVRLLTAGALNAADIGDAAEEVASEIGNLAEAELDVLIDQRLDSARLADETFDKFKNSLETTANSSQNEDDEVKPLLFVVDELDRCRPDYALSVLETIKHFFSVQNVHFLLVCDIDQLVAAVHHRYGIKGHGYTYLEKFIDVRVSFPTPRTNVRERSIRDFLNTFIEGMPDDNEGGNYWDKLKEFICSIAIKKSYSLRKIEKIVSQFAVCVHFTNEKNLRIGAVVFVLCDLKITNPSLFSKAKQGMLSYSELDKHYDFDDDRYEWYIKWLRYFYDETIDRSEPEWQRMGESLYRYNFFETDSVPTYLANEIVDKIG